MSYNGFGCSTEKGREIYTENSNGGFSFVNVDWYAVNYHNGSNESIPKYVYTADLVLFSNDLEIIPPMQS